MKKVVILDRDGVINHDSDDYIKSPDEWYPIDNSAKAIAKLNQAGYICVVATNQSGIGRGLYTLDVFLQICKKMNSHLSEEKAKVKFILYCPHTPDDNCECRKPKAGMLFEAMKRLRAEPENTYFVGDTIRDIQAAKIANIKPILLKTGKGEKTLKSKHKDLSKIEVFEDLMDFASELIDNKIN